MSSTYENRVCRRAFTLVELLVVMTIISILMGLIMAAVTNARTAAQRAQCISNQKNISNAIMMYTTTKIYLPFSERIKGKNKTRYSWRAAILEQMSHKNLADAYDQGTLGGDVMVSEFRCPAGDGTQFTSNYFANCGREDVASKILAPSPDLKDSGSGLFFRKRDDDKGDYKSTLSSITDGMANTILISEGLGVIPQGAGDCAFENWWKVGSAGNFKSYGLAWQNSLPDKNISVAHKRLFPSSRHPNTSIAAFADGSVRPLNRSLKYKTYQCLMAPSDANCSLKWENDPSYE